jgi:hypothetical protein
MQGLRIINVTGADGQIPCSSNTSNAPGGNFSDFVQFTPNPTEDAGEQSPQLAESAPCCKDSNEDAPALNGHRTEEVRFKKGINSSYLV